MGLFRNNMPGISQRMHLEMQYRTARMNLLLMAVFTAINITLISFGSSTYFLFSASIPYFLVFLGAVTSGRMPAEYYEEFEMTLEYVNPTFFWIMLAIAIVTILLFVLCWIASKKHVGWLIAATVLFGIDTVGMFYLYGFNINMLLDIAFHIWVLVYLIIGLVAHHKLKNLPEDEPQPQPESNSFSDVYGSTFGGESQAEQEENADNNTTDDKSNE